MFKNFFILFLTVLLLFACSKKDNAKIVSEPTDEERAVEIYSEAVEALKKGDAFFAGKKFGSRSIALLNLSIAIK